MSSIATLEEYYRDNYQQLVKSLTRSFPNPEDAEDVVQESFARALKYIDKYDTKRAFEGWLRGIIQRTRSDKLSEINNKGMSMDFEEEVEDNLYERTVVKQVHEDIDSKDDKTKKVLIYYYYHGLSFVEIGRLMGRSKVRIKQIVDKFKGEVGSYDIRHGGQRPKS